MAIFDWPAYGTDKAFWPASAEITVWNNNREMESPLSGDIQTIGIPGSKWGWVLNFDEQTWDERGRLIGFLTRLNGKEHRVRMAAPHWPRPLSLATGGTINTAGITTSASAVQYATSLALQGVRGVNLLTASRSLDNAAWTKDGTTIVANANTDPEGTATSDIVRETATTAVHRITQTASGSFGAADYAISAAVSPNGRNWCYLQLSDGTNTAFQFFNASTGAIGSSSGSATWGSLRAAITSVGSSYFRVSLVAAKSSVGTPLAAIFGVASADGTLSYAGNTALGVNFWGAMLEAASVPSSYALPKLQAMDWLSVGGQLLMNVTDTTFSDLGTGTIEVRHSLRAAVGSGAAVTLNAPTGLYILTTNDFSSALRAGSRAPAFSISLREVFA